MKRLNDEMRSTVVKVSIVAVIGSVLAFLFLFQACGPAEAPTPAPSPVDPGPPDAAFDAVKPVIAANCALAGCHAVGNGLPEFDTAAKFKASKAKAELEEGAMPPLPRRIGDGDKAKLLDYLK